MASLDELAHRLCTGQFPALEDAVANALLNHETYFFRDLAAYDSLFAVLDQWRDRQGSRKKLKIWSAGCATGQEPYSVAIRFLENPAQWSGWDIDIHGTDVSAPVLDYARLGQYTQFEIQRGLLTPQLLKWFSQVHPDAWQAMPSLRDAVRFSVHNLMDSCVDEQYDVILCRNVLFYFCDHMRQRIFDILHRALASDGLLLLGAGETAFDQTGYFEADKDIPCIYRPVSAR